MKMCHTSIGPVVGLENAFVQAEKAFNFLKNGILMEATHSEPQIIDKFGMNHLGKFVTP